MHKVNHFMKKTGKLLLALFIFITGYAYSYACSNIIITKGASKDGSVMVTYSADSHVLYGELYYRPAMVYPEGSLLKIFEWDTGKYLGQIPQVPMTYQTVGNMNEHQLIITETTFGGRSELYDSTGVMDYGSLIYITLQRAKTAREAIGVIADLVKEHGYASSGESFSIADKNEAWIMEIIGKGTEIKNGVNVNKGAVWVAIRIPDGYISGHANQSRIDRFPLDDPENCLYAEDVITFAKSKGYYSGPNRNFSFCDAYAPADFGAMRSCEARVWSIFNQLGKGMIGNKKAEAYLDFAMGDNPRNKMPLYIKPAEKVDLKQVADAMRDHYEGTPMDMTKDINAGLYKSPYRLCPLTYKIDGESYFNERPLATQQTGFWLLGQARSWLPDEIGGILWFGVDDAANSALTPIYTNTTRIPECFREGNGGMTEYSPTAAFWLFNRVANFAYLMYDYIHPEIRKAADEFELQSIREVAETDRKALALIENDKDIDGALKVVTDYTNERADKLFGRWQELDKFLLVKFIDGNVKKQNPDGTFTDNGNNAGIPASPVRPGYSDDWKARIKQMTGDQFKTKEVK